MTNTEHTVIVRLNPRFKWPLRAAALFIAVAGFVLWGLPYDRQERLVRQIEGIGGEVETEDWWVWHLGGSGTIHSVSLAYIRVEDAWLKKLGRLSSLKSLSLERTQISDDGLKHLAGLSSLTKLNLTGTHVTDDGVKKLQQALPDCEIVW